jgi:hypothetical protein
MENMPFDRFRAGLHRQNHIAAVGGITGLKFAGLLYLPSVLQAKVQTTPHANLAALSLSIAKE